MVMHAMTDAQWVISLCIQGSICQIITLDRLVKTIVYSNFCNIRGTIRGHYRHICTREALH